MDSEKINIKLLKIIIFEVAKNDGITLPDLIENTKLNYETVNDQVIFLRKLGLLESGRTEIDTDSEDKIQNNKPQKFIKFRQNIETLQKIAKILDDHELSKLMMAKYYKDNSKNYCTALLSSLDEHKLYQLPDADYFEFALRNSPSAVRFYLVDNDISTLRSFYQKCIASTNEKVKDKTKIELFEKCNMYFIWDNLIFEKIQEDKQNELLFDPANYFAGYLPLAERSVEKLLELIDEAKKEKTEDVRLNSKLIYYLKSLLPD